MSAEHLVSNNTFLQLSGGVSAVDVTLNFTAGHGVRLPVIATPQFMFATLVRSTGELERVKITAHVAAADACTIARNQDGTAPLTFSAGDTLQVRIGKGDWDQLLRLGQLDAILAGGGAADALTATLAGSALASLPDGFTICLIGAATNLGNAPSFNLTLPSGATGVKTIVKGNQQPLAGGDIGPFAWLSYRAAWGKWVLTNPVFGSEQAGAGKTHLGFTVPDGYLERDGTTKSRTTYAALLQAITKQSVVTITIATPGVVTWNAHGMPEYAEVTFSTTGGLPTGLAAGTVYYTKNVAANTVQVSATPGGAAINTSGAQSGVHTAVFYPYGAGDGSTTFKLPNSPGRTEIGRGTGTFSLPFDNAAVTPASDAITIPSNADQIITGMSGQFTTTGGLPAGLALATTYWLVRTNTSTFKVASSLANAQNGTVIDITTAGTGVHTFTTTLTARTLANLLGEEMHAESSTELLSHITTTPIPSYFNGGNVTGVNGAAGTPGGNVNYTSNANGGNAAMNNMQPSEVVMKLIKT